MATPSWHSVCTLREEVRTGTLTLADFAADLYGVRTGDAPEVYRDADRFFARTFPTHPMKELVRDVLQRLAGTAGTPVLRLQVAYGGGKTHSLITLLHLAERAVTVADNPTVKEFVNFAGVQPVPSARVAILPFDKFDIHDGLEVVAPNGERRKVMTPWGALAYQLAGDAGLARVRAHEEGWDTPAQPILEELLRAPNSEGKGALVLIDEAVIYGRAAVKQDPRRLGILKDFFQLLTQAVAVVGRACVVATLIASENEAFDETGTKVLQALEDVFRRLQTTSEPVGREDIAEVMRRRLFEKVPEEAQRRPIIDAVLAAYQDSSKLRQAQKDQSAYDRLLRSYPFSPDLLEVFYQKWTELPKFQRTRGALRLLAQALQQSASSDPAPLVGVSALLGPDTALSPAVTEMVAICSEGNDQWTPKLFGELERAREAQAKLPSLKEREIEQGVLAVFLHSQPTGQHAETSDLYALLIHPGVDQAALETGLDGWRALSWFLSENAKTWRLTTQPNLNHVHVHAMQGLSETKVRDEVRAQIDKIKELATTDRDGADRGVQVHRLPLRPADVEDSTDLHYLILGPDCALDPAQPITANVTAFFTTTSGPQNPRTYRNALVALAPEASRLAALRRGVVEFLGWQAIEATDAGKQLTTAQKLLLADRKKDAEGNLPSAVRATYSLVLDLGEDGNVRLQTLKSADSLGITDTRPFARIKAMLAAEERLVTGDLLPELLLPDSYYELWSPGETSKRIRDLLAAFAQFPRLPRFLSAQIFRNAVARGCEDGILVLRIARPDGSYRTLWRTRPTSDELALADLEMLPAADAELAELDASTLAPMTLPNLWVSAEQPLTVAAIRNYFNGDSAPHLASGVLEAAILQSAVQGVVCERVGTYTYFKEQPPMEAITDDMELLPPPTPLSADDLSPTAIPEAWSDGRANLAAVSAAVGKSRGYSPPWRLISDAISSGLQTRKFEIDNGLWPANSDKADQVIIRLRNQSPLSMPQLPLAPQGALTAEASLTPLEVQKLGEEVSKLTSAAPALRLGFTVLFTVEGNADAATVEALNQALAQVSAKLRLDQDQI